MLLLLRQRLQLLWVLQVPHQMMLLLLLPHLQHSQAVRQ
jgi:hypothetical protein